MDADLFFLLNNAIHFPALDTLMAFVTRMPYLIAIPVVLVLARTDGRNIAAMLAVSLCALAATELLGVALKQLIQRPRPCWALQDVTLLVGCLDSFSMPSNHSANMFAFAVPFYFFTRSRLRHVLVAEAALVALSRPYVGVHYPSDVLAGAALGTMVAILAATLYKRAFRKDSPEAPDEAR